MAASGDSGTASSTIVYTHGALGAPSVSLAAMLKAVVFDFDLTVLRIHSYADRIEPEMIAHREWQKDFADLESFKAICEQLVALKVRVAIASFGRKDVITEYLKLAFGDRFSDIFPEEAICTPADVGSIDGHALPDGKNTQIKTILASMGLTDDDRGVLFFDDDRENCAKAATIGLYPFFCPKHLTAVTWTRACDNLPAVQSKFKRSAAASLAAAADTANPAAGHHLASLPTEDPSSSS